MGTPLGSVLLMNEKQAEKRAFGERLTAAMRAAGLEPRASVLERAFNTRYAGRAVTLQSVMRWLKGMAIPTQDKLQVLAEVLHVAPHALRFGTQVMLAEQKREKRWEAAAVSYADRETFDVFLKLPVRQRQLLREVILTFAEAGARAAPADEDPVPPDGK